MDFLHAVCVKWLVSEHHNFVPQLIMCHWTVKTILMQPPVLSNHDPNNHSLHHHTTLMVQAEEVQNATTYTDANKLAKLYRIKGVPYLSLLPSLNFLKSFPYDFMHLIWENLIKNLVLHWTGEFKGLGVGKESYKFPTVVWNAIKEATGKSGSTIPSEFGSSVPSVATHQSQMLVEMLNFGGVQVGSWMVEY